MATAEGSKRCKYCGRPADCPPGPVMTHHRFHNEGCPVGDTNLTNPEAAMAEWKEGYRYGFGDNYIESYRYQYFPKTFILGWVRGKAEIDRLVEVAVERNYSIEE